MSATTLRLWARMLDGEVVGNQVLAPGPNHSASDRSLCVTIGRNGEPVVHSFAGDDWQECLNYVRQKLGLRDLLAKAEGAGEGRKDNTKETKAIKLLTYMLEKGERPQTEIEEAAKEEGISPRTLNRAASQEMVKRRKESFTGRWLWSLI
jgi:hypothetical protein